MFVQMDRMKIISGMIIFLILSYCLILFFRQPHDESGVRKNIIVVFDQTVDNKNAIKKLSQVIQLNLEKQIRDKKLMGAKIQFTTAGSAGETVPFCVVNINRQVGRKKLNILKAKNKTKKCFELAQKKVRNDKRFSTSLLVEAMSSALKRADVIYFISDFAVVDGKNNHEKGKFATPPDLKNEAFGKFIHLVRVPRTGQTYKNSLLIEKWWKSVLYGEKFKISPLRKIKKKKNVRKNESNKAKKILAAEKNKLLICFNSFAGSRAEMVLKLIVKNRKATSIQIEKTTFPEEVSRCLKQKFSAFDYNVAYAEFDQRIQYGGL